MVHQNTIWQDLADKRWLDLCRNGQACIAAMTLIPYGEQILNLVDAVEFKPGHAYADYQAGDKRAPFGFLETLVTGVPSKGFTEFSQAVNQSIKRDEEKKTSQN